MQSANFNTFRHFPLQNIVFTIPYKIHTNQFYSLTIPLCIVAWLPFATFTVTSFAMHKNHALHDFAPQFSGFLRTLFKKASRGMLSANNNVADSRHCTKRPGKPSPAVNVRTGQPDFISVLSNAPLPHSYSLKKPSASM